MGKLRLHGFRHRSILARFNAETPRLPSPYDDISVKSAPALTRGRPCQALVKRETPKPPITTITPKPASKQASKPLGQSTHALPQPRRRWRRRRRRLRPKRRGRCSHDSKHADPGDRDRCRHFVSKREKKKGLRPTFFPLFVALHGSREHGGTRTVLYRTVLVM